MFMRKKFVILIFLFFSCFPMIVQAAGSITVSTGSLSIQNGGSQTFYVTASNAAGRVNISSSNAGVASVSSTSEWVENGSIPITVYGRSAGTASITISVVDAATFDEEPLSNTYSIHVNVYNPAPRPSPYTGVDNRSTNNSLKSLQVKDYSLNKVDDTHYTLEVKNSVEKIVIEGEVEDGKATVTGLGEVSLKVGENIIDIVVTAENGSTKTYSITVNRRDNHYAIKSIKEALKDEEEVIIVLGEEDDVIVQNDLEEIKKTEKMIRFSRYDENKEEVYSIVVDGSSLSSTEDIHVGGQLFFTEEEKFDKLVGYRKGISFEFLKQDAFPSGVSLRLPIKDFFKEEDQVSIYTYHPETNKVERIYKNLKVENGYVEIPLKDSSHYFVSKADITIDKDVKTKIGDSCIVAACVEFVILIIMTGIIIHLSFKRKKK